MKLKNRVILDPRLPNHRWLINDTLTEPRLKLQCLRGHFGPYPIWRTLKTTYLFPEIWGDQAIPHKQNEILQSLRNHKNWDTYVNALHPTLRKELE